MLFLNRLVVVSLLAASQSVITEGQSTGAEGSTAYVEGAPYGFQTGAGSDGHNSYAGGMSIQGDVLVVTGSTYGNAFGVNNNSDDIDGDDSDCFLAFIELPKLAKQADPKIEYKERFGNPSVPEACYTVLANAKEKKMYAIGSTQENGVLTDIRPYGSPKADVYGMILDFSVTDSTALNGGRLLHQSKVQYPVALVQGNTDELYVAYLTSADTTETGLGYGFNPEAGNVGTTDQPNFIEYMPKGGTGFALEIQRLQPKENPTGEIGSQNTLDETWVEAFGASRVSGVAQENVFVTALVQPSNDSLVFAGHTMGHGAALGNVLPQDQNATSLGNWDGFVTKIDPLTGALQKSIRIASLNTNTVYPNPAAEPPDDYITGMCYSQDSIFVTGFTRGILDTEYVILNEYGSTAFLQKIDLETLSVAWVRQIGATDTSTERIDPHVRGVACAVTSDGAQVYMAGGVHAHALLDGQNASQREDDMGSDIFVAQFDTETGGINFVIQTGSNKDDSLAPAGGLVVDEDNNAIILGSTKGSMMRQKLPEEGGVSDVFIMSIGRDDGKFKVPIDQSGGTSPDPNGTTGSGPATQPVPTQPVPTPSPVRQPVQAPSPVTPVMTTTPTLRTPPSNPNDLQPTDTGGGNGGSVAVAIVLSVLVSIGCCFLYKRMRYSQIKLDDDADPISDYLSAFDFGDVEIKHSATGGYHAIYTKPELVVDAVGGSSSSDVHRGERFPFRSDAYLDDDDDEEQVTFGVRTSLSGNVTGGKHDGTNRLAETGSNNRSIGANELSIVQDSLFMDDFDMPSLGGGAGPSARRSSGDGGGTYAASNDRRGVRNHEGGDRGRNNTNDDAGEGSYDGLLDAYNNTWDELNPHKVPDEMDGGIDSGKNGVVESGKLIETDGWGQQII